MARRAVGRWRQGRCNLDLPRLSSQIGDSGFFLAGSLNRKSHEGVPSFEPVPRIELGIGS